MYKYSEQINRSDDLNCLLLTQAFNYNSEQIDDKPEGADDV
jgi:hypothetical protein